MSFSVPWIQDHLQMSNIESLVIITPKPYVTTYITHYSICHLNLDIVSSDVNTHAASQCTSAMAFLQWQCLMNCTPWLYFHVLLEPVSGKLTSDITTVNFAYQSRSRVPVCSFRFCSREMQFGKQHVYDSNPVVVLWTPFGVNNTDFFCCKVLIQRSLRKDLCRPWDNFGFKILLELMHHGVS